MKTIIKKIVFLISALIMSPLTISFRLLFSISKSDQIFASYSQLLSVIPGNIGCYLRTGFYYFALENCNQDVVISFFTLFSQQDTEIDAGVYIGPQCNIGKCHIYENTLLGSGVHIMSGKFQHDFTDLETPVRDQGGIFEKINIGKDCWIGNGSLIMANIGKKCIIGAGSVITKDIPDYSIAAGNPAIILKSRLENNI